jgi:hypothetical protein
MRYQCFAIVEEAMGCKDHEPVYVELPQSLQRNIKMKPCGSSYLAH